MTRAITRTLATGVLVVLAGPLVWSLATGQSFLRVTGSSMSPTYEVGDVLVVRPPAGDELTRVGQVVVVALAGTDGSGGQRYVHRVDALTDDGAWLRGDGNDHRDPVPVRQDAVLGTPQAALPAAVSGVFTFSQSLLGRVTLGATALALLLVPARRRATGPVPAPPILQETT
jgi:signal peptidase